MATEKIRVGIIGANVRYDWGSSAHIPALRALPEFEITAVCTSRQVTADETAMRFAPFPPPHGMGVSTVRHQTEATQSSEMPPSPSPGQERSHMKTAWFGGRDGLHFLR